MKNLSDIFVNLTITIVLTMFTFWFLKNTHKYIKEIIKLNKNKL